MQSILVGAFGTMGLAQRADAALSDMKITRVRVYNPSRRRGRYDFMQQSRMVVTVETDAGITGIGEGGSKDTIEDCAGALIGWDPFRTEYLWQRMYRGSFYPAGREKLHALGALDLALWDIKGKALDVPVYQLLGGRMRDYLECYPTGFQLRGSTSIKETARACIEAGFRCYRNEVEPASREEAAAFNSRKMVDKSYEKCVQIREGVGPDGDWCFDFHTLLDMPDAVRLCNLMEPLNPYWVEDPIRSENPGVFQVLRNQVKVPIAVGEQFGARWDINELLEQNLIDYSRVTLPNAGGITEFMKICALCETQYVGLSPHFCGPISTAAIAHVCGVFNGPVLAECGGGPSRQPYLPQSYDFKDGKMWLNTRPGLGVEFIPEEANFIAEITESYGVEQYTRPDGSYTNW